MRIGVVGNGVVGRATARVWLEHCDEVRVYDVLKERSTHSLQSTLACDIVFICLPEIEIPKMFANLSNRQTHHNFVLRSTVPIGTTRRLSERYGLTNLVHNPEFLTARCSLTDAQMPARNIVGSPDYPLFGNGPMKQGAAYLESLYLKRFPGVPCLCMSSNESELVKLFTNAFFAAKVSIFNEFRSLTDKLGLDWETVLGGILSDGRIAHSHTQVPGPDGRRGFGGACLPKDLRHLLENCFEVGVRTPVLHACENWISDVVEFRGRKGE